MRARGCIVFQFLAFTLSQAGMVVHWLRSSNQGSLLSTAINGLGALATGVTFLIVVVTKFAEGAWLLVVVPTLYLLMYSIRRHYDIIARQVAISGRLSLKPLSDIVAIVPVETPNALLQTALKTACGLSRRVQIVHIKQENKAEDFITEWNSQVQNSIKDAGLPEPELVILESPYRKVVSPILDHVWKFERQNPDKIVVVLFFNLLKRIGTTDSSITSGRCFFGMNC